MHFQGVQLHIELTDEDSGNPNDLIDVLLIDHDLSVGQPSPRQNYTGIYDINFVIMDLLIMARCTRNFQGQDCSQCLPGFTGIMCEINIDDCIGVNCSGNGWCVDGVLSYTCDCDPGFTGAECDMNIDDCVQCDSDIDECLSNPCGMNGQCENQEGSFNCSCNPGFTGDLCQIDIDDCVGVNCSGNGVCVDSLNSFTCQCSPGFSGTLCFEGI